MHPLKLTPWQLDLICLVLADSPAIQMPLVIAKQMQFEILSFFFMQCCFILNCQGPVVQHATQQPYAGSEVKAFPSN